MEGTFLSIFCCSSVSQPACDNDTHPYKNMALHTKIPETIDEVDVIIAGGESPHKRL